jgi:hypothetical protein
MGSTQPREDKSEATSMKNSGSGIENLLATVIIRCIHHAQLP